jgi:hypothetical protein
MNGGTASDARTAASNRALPAADNRRASAPRRASALVVNRPSVVDSAGGAVDSEAVADIPVVRAPRI